MMFLRSRTRPLSRDDRDFQIAGRLSQVTRKGAGLNQPGRAPFAHPGSDLLDTISPAPVLSLPPGSIVCESSSIRLPTGEASKLSIKPTIRGKWPRSGGRDHRRQAGVAVLVGGDTNPRRWAP